MKKFLKIIAIVLAILVVVVIVFMVKSHFDSLKPYLDEDYYTSFSSEYTLEQKYSQTGSHEVLQTSMDSDDKAMGKYRIWYPAELASSNKKYPLIVVTNASNSAALNYEPYFKRLSSWGFIVAGNDDRQAGKGASTSITLDKMLSLSQQADSIFYQKIDADNVGLVGYSQGGAGALRAATEFENSHVYKTIFTGSAAYAQLAKNMGWEYDAAKIKIPYFMVAGTGKTDDSGNYGEKDFAGVAPLFSLKENYDKISPYVLKVRARVKGAEHEDMLAQADGYMTAWMLWQLCGDAEAASVFQGETPELMTNARWQDIEKNC